MTMKNPLETPRRRGAENTSCRGDLALGQMAGHDTVPPVWAFPRRLGASAFSHYWRLPALLLLLAQGVAAAPDAPANPAVPADAPLGRLFFTPEERIALDRQRLTGLAEAGDVLTVNGVTRNRANGKSTVWINGRPWHEAKSLTGVSPAPRDTTRVAVETGKGQPLALKIGDSANRLTGETQDKLAGGRVAVHPGKP